jgi:hypothetical protein
LTAADFKNAVPFKDMFPEWYESWKRGRGRPRLANPKKMLAVRLSANIVDRIEAKNGYTATPKKILQREIEKGAL